MHNSPVCCTPLEASSSFLKGGAPDSIGQTILCSGDVIAPCLKVSCEVLQSPKAQCRLRVTVSGGMMSVALSTAGPKESA